jgi:large subunit ribosomal protein L21
MFAVIKSGGRQYKVSVGQTLEVNRLPVADGEQVKFEEVLLISDADGSRVGTPLVDNAAVLATAVKQGRGEKLIVFRYKSKKRFRHRRGHRQELTILTIDDIVADGQSLITGKAPEAREETPVEDELVAPETTTETESPDHAEPKTTRRRRTVKVEDAESEDTESEDTESKEE